MKRVLHPSGKQIVFDSKWHRYSLDNTVLKSVSKVLDKHFPFDEFRVSAAVAARTKQRREDIVSGWKKQATLGRNVHAYIEAKLLGETPPMIPESEKHGEEDLYIPVAQSAVERVLEEYEVVATEAIIGSAQLGLAGTIDFIGQHKKTGTMLIGDWKTSGSVASNFRFGSFETPSLGVLSHLPNVKFNRYAMQVLLYGYILRLEGYHQMFGKEILTKPLEFGIVQLMKNESGQVISEFKAVSPKLILPRDGEWTVDDLVRHVIAGGGSAQ